MSNENIDQVQYTALEFIKGMHNLIFTARIHKDNNKLLKECLFKFKRILDAIIKDDDCEIKVWRDRFHFGGLKIRHGKNALNIINEMIAYFTERGIGGLRFSTAARKASPKDLMIFIRLIDASEKNKNSFNWLNNKFTKYGISWLKILEIHDEEKQSPLDDDMIRREKAKYAYVNALDTVKEVAEKASKGVAGVLKARRLAQNIVDLIHEDRSLMLGLTTLQEYDDYTYTHSVNVSLLATCLGKQIGLSKVVLEHLAVCGLFHDLGKVGIPKDVLLKKSKLNDDEWKKMQGHPLIGVKKILRLNADKELRSKIILGPFEHHLNPDMTGYPKTHFKKSMSLTGKILRIVDVYEALTANRKYRPRPFTPDEALRKMWNEGEKSFDLILLKIFIQMMGIFPIGSIVELIDGRFAMVTEYPDGPLAPPLLVLIDENGYEGVSRQGETVKLNNLMEKGSSSIKRGVSPSSIGVSVAELLFLENSTQILQ